MHFFWPKFQIVHHFEESHLLNISWKFELLKVTGSGVNKGFSNPNTVRTSCNNTQAQRNLAKKRWLPHSSPKTSKTLNTYIFSNIPLQGMKLSGIIPHWVICQDIYFFTAVSPSDFVPLRSPYTYALHKIQIILCWPCWINYFCFIVFDYFYSPQKCQKFNWKLYFG